MGKNNYNNRYSSSSSMYNDDVRELQCWCPRICVVRRANTVNNPGRPFYACPLHKVCLTMVIWCQKKFNYIGPWIIIISIISILKLMKIPSNWSLNYHNRDQCDLMQRFAIFSMSHKHNWSTSIFSQTQNSPSTYCSLRYSSRSKQPPWCKITVIVSSILDKPQNLTSKSNLFQGWSPVMMMILVKWRG